MSLESFYRKESVFYSFHYDNDVMRVQQVRQIGVLDDTEPVTANKWETVWRGGDAAVKRWIDANMVNKRCVIVLIGSQTAERPLVKYEIKKAWDDRKGLFGIHIHNLTCPNTGTCRKGPSPFDGFTVGTTPLSQLVRVYDPSQMYAYSEIQANLTAWVGTAIEEAKRR